MHKLQTAKTKIVIVGLGGVGGYYGGYFLNMLSSNPIYPLFCPWCSFKAIQSRGLKVSDENQSLLHIRL